MNSFVVIDTETGGLSPDRDSLLSIAAVVWREGELVGEIEVFVNEPELSIDAGSRAIHGLDPEWIKQNGLPPARAVSLLECFFEQYFPEIKTGGLLQLAGHNVSFDIGFLKRLYRVAGHPYPEFYSRRLLDTASLALFFILAGRLPSKTVKSDELFEYFQVLPAKRGSHSALEDAKATARLITAFLRAEHWCWRDYLPSGSGVP